MSESKKLSELIYYLILNENSRQEYFNSEFAREKYDLNNIKEEIEKTAKQIDQKFEELRCECTECRFKKMLKDNKKICFEHETLRDQCGCIDNKKDPKFIKIEKGDFEKMNLSFKIKAENLIPIEKCDCIQCDGTHPEKDKWSDIEEIVKNRIKDEFQKHFCKGDWITYATKKIISSLKEYEQYTAND